jgi:hypothetical protein
MNHLSTQNNSDVQSCIGALELSDVMAKADDGALEAASGIVMVAPTTGFTCQRAGGGRNC